VMNVLADPYYIVGNNGATITIADNDQFTPTNVDIGSVGTAGGMSYNSGTGAYTVSGAGNLGSTATDAFNFSYTTMTGDGTLIARVSSFPTGTTWARTGLMMRDSLAAGSQYAMASVTKGQGAVWARRGTANTNASATVTAGVSAPVWLKLTRVGSLFTAF